MNHRFILFLVFAVAVLVGTHFLLYMSIVRLWDGANATLKVALFIFLSFLSLSFIASIFLIHWWENLVTTAFYIFSATWLGLFINLWMAIGLSYLIIGIVRMFGYAPSTSFVAAVLFMAAFLYSAYGVYNAFHPRLKRLEVEMRHLPEQWIDKTAVQLSDVHLGRVHGVGFLEKVVTKVNSLNPDVVFITGDLFDGMSGRLDQFVDPLNRLEAEKGIFYITGNHETYMGVNRALGILRKTKIHLMKNEVVDLEGLQIVGINYPGLGRSKDMQGIKGFPENFSRDRPSILLFHTPTNIRQENELAPHTSTYWVPDTTLAMNREMGIGLQLSGHTHRGQIFPLGYLTKFIYKGYDYGLRDEGTFSIYTTCGVGTWGPPMRTGNSPEIVVIKLRQAGGRRVLH